MHQRLHLLIVNREQRTALAARFGSRWLLPSLECGEMIRAGPLVARWCGDRCVGTDVAGQWCGRLDGNGVDWLMAVSARDARLLGGTSLEWIALDALGDGRSVLDYQTWAVARCLERAPLPSVNGPFGTLDWPAQVRSWIADTLKIDPCGWTSYRTSAYETVMGLETNRGRVYFKGLAADRTSEPTVTDRFAAIEPDAFARTIALDRREDGTLWWVTAECPGRPAGDPIAVAAALAQLQCRLQSAARDLPRVPRTVPSVDTWTDFPESWIPMDLDPSNVLIDGDCVRFVDLDDSFLGPAPLAMAAFVRRSNAGSAAYRAYEQSWSPPLARLEWSRLEKAAIALQTSLGWVRVQRTIERGELHADLDVLRKRIDARLARALQRG